jgi:hypothetical protein
VEAAVALELELAAVVLELAAVELVAALELVAPAVGVRAAAAQWFTG